MNLDRTQLLISFLLLNLLCCEKQKFGKFCAEKDKIKNLQKHTITFQSVTDEARHDLDLLQGVLNGLCEHLRACEQCVYFCEHEQLSNFSCGQQHFRLMQMASSEHFEYFVNFPLAEISL